MNFGRWNLLSGFRNGIYLFHLSGVLLIYLTVMYCVHRIYIVTWTESRGATMHNYPVLCQRCSGGTEKNQDQAMTFPAKI
jgi:hypothetical protein